MRSLLIEVPQQKGQEELELIIYVWFSPLWVASIHVDPAVSLLLSMEEKPCSLGSGEMAKWLRAQVALTENPH